MSVERSRPQIKFDYARLTREINKIPESDRRFPLFNFLGRTSQAMQDHAVWPVNLGKVGTMGVWESADMQEIEAVTQELILKHKVIKTTNTKDGESALSQIGFLSFAALLGVMQTMYSRDLQVELDGLISTTRILTHPLPIPENILLPEGVTYTKIKNPYGKLGRYGNIREVSLR